MNMMPGGMTPDAAPTSDFGEAALAIRQRWISSARPLQVTPGGDWDTWMLLAGRGTGKTRAGAEDAFWAAASNPNWRVGMIGATHSDAQKTMIEGESGLLAIVDPYANAIIESYNKSDLEIKLKNGSLLVGYSAEKPDRLRGPQFNRVWADELAAWQRDVDTWDNIQFGLRLGTDTRTVVTTTPRPKALVMDLHGDPTTVITRESTYANVRNLSPKALRKFLRKYEGTSKAAQEIHGEILSEAEGALWTRAMLEGTRRRYMTPPEAWVVMSRIIVSLDPAVTNKESSDECGIIVSGKDRAGDAHVLEDASGKYTPGGWAAKALELYERWRADRIVGEVNNGGDLIEHTIRSSRFPDGRSGATVPYTAVRASVGKRTRAEPVSAFFEQGRGHLCGRFEKLENQLVSWLPNDEKSPDRLDAMVWGFTALDVGGGEVYFG